MRHVSRQSCAEHHVSSISQFWHQTGLVDVKTFYWPTLFEPTWVHPSKLAHAAMAASAPHSAPAYTIDQLVAATCIDRLAVSPGLLPHVSVATYPDAPIPTDHQPLIVTLQGSNPWQQHPCAPTGPPPMMTAPELVAKEDWNCKK